MYDSLDLFLENEYIEICSDLIDRYNIKNNLLYLFDNKIRFNYL